MDTVNGEAVSYPSAGDGEWAGEFLPNITVDVVGDRPRAVTDLLSPVSTPP